MKDLIVLGERIRSQRISQGLKMSDLAAMAAVSKDTLSSLENGRNVTTESLARILKALGYGNALVDLLPEPLISPYEAKKLQGKQRQRVR